MPGEERLVPSSAAANVGRPLAHLVAGVLLLGLANALVGPYLVLFGVEQAHLAPVAIGGFVSLTALSGIAASAWLARRYDRTPSRRPGFLALAAGAAGYLMLTTTTAYLPMLAIAAAFLGPGSAAFPQLFALARTYLNGGTAARGVPLLRAGWSLAWAIGPVLGSAVLARWGFSALFLAAAAGNALVAPPLLLLGRPSVPRAVAPAQEDAPSAARPLLPAALGVALFHTAMSAGSVALPLDVTAALGRPDRYVGLLFGLAALAEVPASLGLLLLPSRVAAAGALQLGALTFVAYYALAAAAPSLPLLLLAQPLRGVAIAVVGSLGITYFQERLPGGAGRGSALFANAASAGSLVAGLVAGVAIQALGARAALLLCALLSVAAWAALRRASR